MSTAYVHKATTILNRILVPCIIDKVNVGTSTNPVVMALWDTGACKTCISETLAQRLGLMVEDQMDLTMADRSVHTSNVYSVQITMGEFTLPYIRVCDLPMANSGHDVIIGMDFMSQGDLSITNYKGKTILTFREPSLSSVNYVDDLRKYIKIHEVWIKHGNNQCPCKSGKSWDKCHGK